MILAKEFSRSRAARQSDFTTSPDERGVFLMKERSSKRERLVRGSLIGQFASSEATSFADAAELIRPHVDGIDLNCGELSVCVPVTPSNVSDGHLSLVGCPQPWAYKEHIGSFLLRQPNTYVLEWALKPEPSAFQISRSPLD